MLPNIISWDLDSHHITYSAIHGEERKLWTYDSESELISPIKFYEGQWFELEHIHSEQMLIHFWGEGIYLYDSKNEKAQKLVAPEKCRTFSFFHAAKQLIYNNNDDYYLFDPKSKQNEVIIKQTSELIIDPKHRTFITISSQADSSLLLYYKNEAVFTETNAFGIYQTEENNRCLFFSEEDDMERTLLKQLDLEKLEKADLELINGVVQSANLVGQQLFININFNNAYQFYLYDLKKGKLNHIDSIQSESPVYAQLSPNGKKIAYIDDQEGKTAIQVIEIP